MRPLGVRAEYRNGIVELLEALQQLQRSGWGGCACWDTMGRPALPRTDQLTVEHLEQWPCTHDGVTHTVVRRDGEAPAPGCRGAAQVVMDELGSSCPREGEMRCPGVGYGELSLAIAGQGWILQRLGSRGVIEGATRLLLCKRAALWPVGVLRIDGKCSGHAACISLQV